MKKHQNTQLRGKLPLLATALSIACFSGIYLGGRKSETKSTAATPAVTGIQTKSKRALDQLAENQNHPGNASKPVALWPAPVSIAQESKTQTAQHNHADHEACEHEAAEPAKFRRANFDTNSLASLAALGDLKKGDSVMIPLMDGTQVSGRVNLVQPDEQGWTRIGGELSGADAGSFTMGSDGKEVAAMILLPGKDLAYEVSGQLASNATMEEKPLSEALCSPLPAAEDAADAVQAVGEPQAVPPILSSRPGATAVVYLDFDGETVTDPSWNGGNTIVAEASPLTNAQITQVWQRVSEDFAPFDLDITTDVNRYNNAPVGSRMRCIITPTDAWYKNGAAGGVAYLNSFDRAGAGYSSTIPCWAFNGGVNAGAETISHEVGHTFGLSHDGRTEPVEGYYYGHGAGTVSWAPIMGVGFYSSVTQWSKGEYLNANQKQDDIAIIANATNGFGFIPDETGDTPATAAALNAPGGTVNQAGVITQANDTDSYAINVQAGTVNITATPFVFYPNLDILLELQNANGVTVASANPDQALNATINQNVAAGVYYVKVKGTGRGDVLGDGYSSYGSIGHYRLTGTLPSGQLAPVITSASSASGVQGKPFTYQITATNSPTSYSATGLPAGLTINTSSGLISGTPTAAGASNIDLGATNATGTGNGSLALTVTGSTTSPGLSNTSPIAITDGKTNTTTINVSGVTGTVTQVKVNLNGLSHTWPDDVDVLLVGPGGQKVMLMSDMGGGIAISNTSLTFSDTAASALPDSTRVYSGSYKPGNIGYENLYSPAPAGPYGTSLGVFNGLNPNGAWKLYVADDAGADIGSIARGWSLVFTTSASLVQNNTIKWSQPDGSTTIWNLDNQNRYTGEFTTVDSE